MAARPRVKVAHKTNAWQCSTRCSISTSIRDKSWNTMISRVSLYESCSLSVSLPETRATRKTCAWNIFILSRGVHVSQGANWKGRPGLFINDRARFHCAFIFHVRTGRDVYFTLRSQKRSSLSFFPLPPLIH